MYIWQKSSDNLSAEKGQSHFCSWLKSNLDRSTIDPKLDSTWDWTHLDLSRCPLLHKSLQPPVLRTVRVMIQPESSGWLGPHFPLSQ